MLLTQGTKTRDDGPWVKSTFVVTIGTSDFSSYRDQVAYQLSGSGGGGDNHWEKMLSDDSALPVFFSKKVCRDTSLGGNDAVNCYYAFNEDDDLVSPFTQTDFGLTGLGRVYKQVYNDHQRIMWLTFGQPQWNSLTSFYKTAINPQLASLMNKGTIDSGTGVAALLGNIVGTAIKLPVVPLLYLDEILGHTTKVSKYFDFAPNMPLYYRTVNSIIRHLAVNMHLAKDDYLWGGSKGSMGQTGSTVSDMTYGELFDDALDNGGGGPEIFRQTGFDIIKILSRRWAYMQGDGGAETQATDQMLAADVYGNDALTDTARENTGWLGNLFETVSNAANDAYLYVGFRIEKSVDATESLQSSTAMPEVASQVNSKIQSARNMKYTMFGGNIDTSGFGKMMGDFFTGISNFAKGAVNAVGLSGIDQIVTGAGLIDFPEVWQDSTFSKNYSFTMDLRCPYGDPMSIFQTLYVPLALLIGGAFPRATGAASYTSPFLVRAYCNGMFAIPMGIIDSISITRGTDQHGWNFQHLPTVVRVSFTIKDLSPTMYVAVGSDQWAEVFGQNSSFQEYLLTLSGMGIRERRMLMERIRRRANYAIDAIFNGKLSPFHWGIDVVDSFPGRLIRSVVPATGRPD